MVDSTECARRKSQEPGNTANRSPRVQGAVNSGTNHIIGNMESQAKIFRNAGAITGKAASKSRDVLTPILQKWYGLINFNSELDTGN